MRRFLALLAAAAAACATASSAARSSPHVGRPIDVVAADLSGRVVPVAEDRGRVRIVDFWATWCEPCREAFPFYDRLLRQDGGRGFAVYAVSFDEDASQIPIFLSQVPVSFRVLWDKGGERWAAPYDIQRLPTSLVVDRQGLVRFVHEGFDASTARETRDEVERLLAEPRPVR